MEHYILVDQKPVVEKDLLKWAQWFQTDPKRIIARDECKGQLVSTVFLGIDHGFGSPEPILFETLVFNGPFDGEMNRYVTFEEAKRGHDEMLKRVRGDFNAE